MPLPRDIVAAVADYVDGLGGYDLQEIDLGPIATDGWANFPSRRWRYHKLTTKGEKRWAEAVTVNPTPEQVAKWTVDAAQAAGISDVLNAAKRASLEIRNASGFHFLVRGVHLEAMTGGDPKAYPFFEGVTVKLKSIPTYTTAALTTEQIDSACHAKGDDIIATGQFGRILSTSREEYTGCNPGADVSGARWPVVVGAAYRRAWGQDMNSLIRCAVAARKAEWGF